MKRILAMTLALLMVFNLMVPLFSVTYAAQEGGFLLEHYFLDGTTEITDPIDKTLDETVKTRISFSTVGLTKSFYDTKIVYPLPAGTTYVTASENGFVTSKTYDPGTHSVIYTLASPDVGPPSPLANELESGVTADLEVTFKFNTISPYPDDTTLTILGPTVTWHEQSDASDPIKTLIAESRTINYTIADSWSLNKTGTSDITVPNDPTVTALDATYHITLTGGNINLKDVVITDTLPANATVKSSDMAYTLDGNLVSWTLDDVLVGTDYDIEVVISYVIDRDGNGSDDGVIGGRSRTNSASVVGYDIITNSSGEINSGLLHTFIKNSDSATTNFNVSTATWGIAVTPTAEVEIPLNTNITTVDEVYTIALTGGDIILKDSVMVFTFDDDVISVPNSGGGVVDLPAKTITWSLPTINVGNQNWPVTLRYNVDRGAGGVKKDDTRNVSVNISGYPIAADGNAQGLALTFNPGSDNAVTTFDDMVINWSAYKTVNPGSFQVPNTSVDELTDDFTYTIRVLSSGTTNNNIPIKEVTVIDTLPAHANLSNRNVTYPSGYHVSGNGVGVKSFTNVGGVLTWVLTVADSTVEPQIDVYVNYSIDGANDGGGIVQGSNATNNITISAIDYSDNPIPLSGTNNIASRSVTFGTQPAPQPSTNVNITGYAKDTGYETVNYDVNNTSTYPGNKNFEEGDTIEYYLQVSNENGNGNALLAGSNLVLNDLSSHIDFTTFNTGSSSDSVAFTFQYQLDKSGLWVDGGDYNTNINSTINFVDLPLGGSKVTDIRLNYTNDMPDDFVYTTTPKLIGLVAGGVSNAQEVKLDISFNSSYRAFRNNIVNISAKTDDVYFRVFNNFAWVTKFDKKDITNETSYYTTASVDFDISLTLNENYGTDSLTGVTIVDYLPAAFNSSDTTFEWLNEDTFNASYGIDTPVMSKEFDNVTGITKITWQWPQAYSMPENTSFVIKYRAKFQTYAGIGDHTNRVYMMSSSDYHYTPSLSMEADSIVVDDSDNYDNRTTDKRLIGTPETVTVVETPSLSVTKSIKAELDENYSSYPDVGTTTPGGSADYKIEIFNSGNVPLDNVELIDIFPYKNDTGVVNPAEARNSLWSPYLIQAISEGRKAIVKDSLGNITSADLSLEYSSSKDPIRLNNDGSGNVGTENPNWLDLAPTDITSVKSLRLRVSQFETAGNVAKSFGAGEKITIEFKMRAPVSAPISSDVVVVDPYDYEAAWSSVSMTATRYGSLTYLNRAEPKKVGLIVKGNPRSEIGNFVWFDQNKDGIQNDGYDGQNAGLNGVTVILKDNFNTEIDRTITAADDSGNPGFYLFPNLPVGTYHIEFEIPSGYKITGTDLGGDDSLDSDVYEAGVYRTPNIVISNESTKDLSYDMGLISDDDQTMDLSVTKVATGYKALDDSITNFGVKSPLNVGEGARFRVYVENTGSLTLTNVLVSDQLPDFSFALSNSLISSDANLSLNGDNEVIILSLAPGVSYDFDGEYVIKGSDDTGSELHNTVRVYANEITNKLIPTYEEASTYVDVASIQVDKYVTHIKKIGTNTLIPAIEIDDYGLSAGDTIYYEIEVTNTGSCDLTQVAFDDQLELQKTGNPNPVNQALAISNISSLLQGASKTVNASYKVASNDEGQLKNVVGVTSNEIRTPEIDTEITTLKGLNLFKTVLAVNGNMPIIKDDTVVVKLGDVITYSIDVKNTSDGTTYTNINLTDKVTGSGHSVSGTSLTLTTSSIASLAPNEVSSQTINYTVTKDDFNDSNTKQLSNTVYLTSDSGTNRSAVVHVDLAGFTISKSSNKTTFRSRSELINYTIDVKNNGTIDLDDVTITDPLTGLNETIASFTVDQEKSYDTTYTVKDTDILAKRIINTGTISDDIAGIQSDDVTLTYYKEIVSNIDHTPDTPARQTVKTTPPDDQAAEEVIDAPEEVEKVERQEHEILERVVLDDGRIIFVPKAEVIFISIPTQAIQGDAVIVEDGTAIYTPHTISAWDGFELEYIIEEESEIIWIEIAEEETALGAVLPQTGEYNTVLTTILGTILLYFGLYFIFKKKKKIVL